MPDDLSSEISWLTPTLASPSQSSRGGARTARVSQHPRSAMTVWAEDKVSREVPGLNMLTVRMLLRAEQRTVSAVLHARSEAQTKEVICVAFRRAGLTMGAGAHEEIDMVSLDMTTALRQQTEITGQIANRLAGMPTNHDVVRLLKAAQAHNAADATIMEQIMRIMTVLVEVRGHIMSMTHMSQPTQNFHEEQQEPLEQPRVWDAFGEAWRQGTPTPLGDTSLPTSPVRPETDAEEIEMGNIVEGEEPETRGAPTAYNEVTLVRGDSEPPPETRPRPMQEFPTPRRLPLAYAPGGVVADPVQALRNASRSSQERARRGSATRPFRSGR